VIPVTGTPFVSLRVDKPQGRLTLRTPIKAGSPLPGNKLAHIRTEISIEDGITYADISTTDPRIVVDGYSMLMAVADRIQHDGADPLVALDQTLEIWRSILRTRTRLSPEAEVGLFGELLLLRAILSEGTSGGTAWRGGFGEEHDFGFTDADVEVKTTSGEQRRHWIHGLTQLVPTGDMPLWLVSLQITRGGDGQGETLPELIDDVLAIADSSERTSINTNLSRIGWDDAQRDLFGDSWRMRSIPLALRVQDDFPRLTPDLLAGIAADTASIQQVRYEIDVTGRNPSSSPPPAVAVAVEFFREAVPDA
jgi:hypothetical protein